VADGKAIPGRKRRSRKVYHPLTDEALKFINQAFDEMELEGTQRSSALLFDEMELEGTQRSSALLLLAIPHSGTTNPDKLSKVTGLQRSFCRDRCKRLRDNEVISDQRLHVEWFSDDPGIAQVSFVCDVLVAEGLVSRRSH
jgi:hypothetical protein